MSVQPEPQGDQQRMALEQARPKLTLLGAPEGAPGAAAAPGGTSHSWTLFSRPRRLVIARHPRAVRVLNVAVASVGLLLALPLVVLIAAAIKVTSTGPVLFRQVRVGLDRRTRHSVLPLEIRRRVDYGGRLFTMYKFRTMRAVHGDGGQRWAIPDDPRITGVGRVLRKLRLDELPQLVNVVKGDMNIVGPRPEQPDIVLDLRQRIGEYHRRQKVLPGITGWAQVNHAYDQTMEDVRRKVLLDLEYIERRSLWEDLRIMLRTLPVMLLRRGSL